MDRPKRRFGHLLKQNRAQRNIDALTSGTTRNFGKVSNKADAIMTIWDGPEHILNIEPRNLDHRDKAEQKTTNLPDDEQDAALMDQRRNFNEYEQR